MYLDTLFYIPPSSLIKQRPMINETEKSKPQREKHMCIFKLDLLAILYHKLRKHRFLPGIWALNTSGHRKPSHLTKWAFSLAWLKAIA